MEKTDPIEFGKETLLPYAWTQNGRSNKNWTLPKVCDSQT
jgi:hypothetical protein